MQRFKIVHNTYYNFSGQVTLGPHELRLRPRVDHEMRIESSKLTLRPPAATLHWHRDVESNSVGIATFDTPANQLAIESELIIEQYNESPLDFLVAPDAVNYPFEYSADDAVVLAPYLKPSKSRAAGPLNDWIAGVWKPGDAIQTYGLLERLNRRIHETMKYQRREEPGVQTPAQTLAGGTGSCRDFATLLMETARQLGLASRFVSGYLHVPPSISIEGATHAWMEVYLPGAGWKGFDPTIGEMAGEEHFAVAVARSPEAVPPVAGSFTGPPGSSMDVGVWVSRV